MTNKQQQRLVRTEGRSSRPDWLGMMGRRGPSAFRLRVPEHVVFDKPWYLINV